MVSQYLDRRAFIGGVAGAVGASFLPNGVFAAQNSRLTKTIPSTGEAVPVIGMGTSRTFDVNSDPNAVNNSIAILNAFFDMGGTIIDSSPMYGSSESVLGKCLNSIDEPKDMYAATKVWTTGESQGKQQMSQSQDLWGVDQFDLMAIHNFKDWQTHLKTLKAWKEQGKIRHIGITTSHGRFHSEMADAIVKQAEYDWVQFTYSIQERKAESRLLPMALEHGKAVMVNRPFGRGGLFSLVKGKALPDWAAEIDVQSWGQYFLKFVVSHPAVTCAIPATSKVKNMKDNMGANFGRLPDQKMREEMIKYVGV
ncbi:MAG: aldo/keto reductase [Pseudomonadota bacterium]